MSMVLLKLTDAAVRREAGDALRAHGYEVMESEPLNADDSTKDVSKQILDSGAAVAILDYLPTDAFGIKLLQSVTDETPSPSIIFVLPSDTEPSHLIMAVNEGASALLSTPLDPGALLNYVDRAINGPGRFRSDIRESLDSCEELAQKASVMRRQNTAFQKLICRLLSTMPSEQNRRALLVSDSRYQLDLLKKQLENHGYMVYTAANAEEGLQTALAEKPLIVVSDLEMEGQNGIEFCHSLKIVNKFVPCHFVVCTANQARIPLVMTPGNGVDDCIVKPGGQSDAAEFVARVSIGLLL